MSLEQKIEFELNGRKTEVSVPVSMSALTLLRDVLELTGTKRGCDEGECGACTILVDGVSMNACLLFAVDCDGRAVTTIEGLATVDGLSPLQRLFVEKWAVQCGFCTPGMIVQGAYLLSRKGDLSPDEIERGIEGNLCRCTGYRKIVEAIREAAEER
jgi:carbon-monoxide dehydrogenase small subunit